MIVYFLLANLMFAQPAPTKKEAAFSALKRCTGPVFFSENYLFSGYGTYLTFAATTTDASTKRPPTPGYFDRVELANPEKTVRTQTTDGVLDFAVDGRSLFVLTYTAIEEWDAVTLKPLATYPTYHYDNDFKYKQNPSSWTRVGDKLVIAHGRLGYSVFNLKTKSLETQAMFAIRYNIVNRPAPVESQAVAVAPYKGSQVIFLMDNFSRSDDKPALRGFLLFDLNQHEILKEIPDLDPGAESLLNLKGTLSIGFPGFLVKVPAVDFPDHVNFEEMANRTWSFPAKGTPIGRPTFDEKNIYTCFRKAPEKPGGKYESIPMILNRKVLGF